MNKEVTYTLRVYLDEDQVISGLVRLSNNAKVRTNIKDNVLQVFPINRQEGELAVIVDQGIKIIDGCF